MRGRILKLWSSPDSKGGSAKFLASPQLEKLENNFKQAGGEFREFALKDLFEITGTKSLDEGKLDFVENGINFVGRVKHGIKGKIEPQPFEPNEPNTITASVIGYKYATFQTQPYYCSQNINKLTPSFWNQ